MASANEQLRDAAVSHQVDLTHYSNGVVRRMVAILNRVDSDLIAKLSEALDRLDGAGFQVDRLESLLLSVRTLNAHAYAALRDELPAEMRRLTNYEAGYQRNLFGSVLDVTLRLNAVVVEQTYAAAMARPFQGRLLAEWIDSLEADRAARIRDNVRMGFVENQSIQEIITRIRGTRANGYTDGIIEIDRRNAEAVVRTAVQHTAGFTRDRFMEANADLVKAVQWVSTLDTRTTTQCMIRDGLQYTVEHAPIGHLIPWLGGPGRLHWNCRSSSCPVLRSFRDLGIPLDEADAGTRASLDGQVAADTTYGDWLSRQSAARQDEVLGPLRGAALRRGDIAFDRFFNDKGRFLTLEELHQRTGIDL